MWLRCSVCGDENKEKVRRWTFLGTCGLGKSDAFIPSSFQSTERFLWPEETSKKEGKMKEKTKNDQIEKGDSFQCRDPEFWIEM